MSDEILRDHEEQRRAEKEIMEWDGDLERPPEPLVELAQENALIYNLFRWARRDDVGTVNALAITVWHLAKRNASLTSKLTRYIERGGIMGASTRILSGGDDNEQ